MVFDNEIPFCDIVYGAFFKNKDHLNMCSYLLKNINSFDSYRPYCHSEVGPGASICKNVLKSKYH